MHDFKIHPKEQLETMNQIYYFSPTHLSSKLKRFKANTTISFIISQSEKLNV